MQKIKNISFNSKTLSAAVLVVVILISIIVFYINSSINKINYQETQPNKEFNTDNNYIPIGNNNDEDDPLANKNIINIILIGKDKSSEEGTRSDSIIIATIKKKDKTLKLTSLMRDLYVPIPDQMDNRINAAYSLGGMELLSRTIEENFAIEIEGCIEVDFSGFINSIDTIGGVDIELNKDEAYYLSNISGLSFTEGINNLSGKTALAYSRIRYIGNADYERTERQRNVLVAVFNKLKDSGLKTLLGLVDDVLPFITTNFTSSQIFTIVTNVILSDISNIESYRIPVDGEFIETNIRDMDVLLPDISENSRLLKEYIEY
jgi:LCP family protein required for cell wall assembly